MTHVHSPFQALVAEWLVEPGSWVPAGTALVVLESMKMEHEVRCDQAGQVLSLHAVAGDTVAAGALLVSLDAQAAPQPVAEPRTAAVPSALVPRADLQRLRERHRLHPGCRPAGGGPAPPRAGAAHRTRKPGRPVRP